MRTGKLTLNQETLRYLNENKSFGGTTTKPVDSNVCNSVANGNPTCITSYPPRIPD